MRYIIITGLVLLRFLSFGQCSKYDIIVDKSGVCEPAVLKFIATNVDKGSTLQWNYGTGWINGSDTFFGYFNNAAKINIQCEISLPSGFVCKINKNQISEIYPKPKIVFETSRKTLCNGIDTVTFFDKSTNSFKRNWVIDGKNYFNANKTIVHQFTTIGLKSISMVVESEFGCRNLKQFDSVIQVYPDVKLDLKFENNNGCSPRKVSIIPIINKNGNTITSFDWWTYSGLPSRHTKEILDTVLYTYPGDFDINATLITNNGCKHQFNFNKIIKIGKLDSLNINFSDTVACQNTFIKVFEKNTNLPGLLSWQFPNATKIIEQNNFSNSINYTQSGKYDVLVNYNYNGCYSSKIYKQKIRVRTVKSDFKSDDNFHCLLPHTIHFKNNSISSETGTINYKWQYFKNNQFLFESSKINDSITVNNMGMITTKLISTHQNGCTDTLVYANYIRTELIKPNFDGIPLIACLNQTIHFNQATPPSSYKAPDKFFWTFYDKDNKTILGTSKLSNPKFSFPDTGYYHVKMVANNFIGCKDSLKKDNMIKIVIDKINFKLIDTLICKGSFVKGEGISSPNEANFEFTWNFTNTETGELTSIKKNKINDVFNTPGRYNLNFIHQIYDGCLDSLQPTHILKVNGVSTKIQIDTASGCLPFKVEASSSIISDYHYNFPIKKYKYKWFANTNDGVRIINDTLANTQFIFDKKGIYTIYLKTINAAGCEDIQQIGPIYAGVQSVISLNDITICENSDVIAYNSSYLKPTGFEWLHDPSIQIVQNQLDQILTLKAKKEGIYKIGLIANKYQTCFDTSYIDIKVIKVKVDFRAVDEIIKCAPAYTQFISKSEWADTLTWSFGDQTLLKTIDSSVGYIYKKNTGLLNGFNVKLFAKSNEGCSDSIIKYNYVKVLGPRPDFEIINNKGCEPLNVIFNKTGGDIFKFYLNYNDGNPLDTLKLSNHIYHVKEFNKDFQTFLPEIYAIDSLGCGAKFISKDTIKVYKSPEIKISNFDTLYCIYENISYQIDTFFSNSLMSQYKDNDNLFDVKPNDQLTKSGSFELIHIANNKNGCSDTLQNSFYVFEKPKSSFELIGSTCLNNYILIQNTSANKNKIKSIIYQISGFNESISTISDTSILFNYAGEKLITQYLTDNNNCKDTAFKTIKIYQSSDIQKANLKYISNFDDENIKIASGQTDYNRFLKAKFYFKNSEIYNSNLNQDFDFLFKVNNTDTTKCIDMRLIDSCNFEGELANTHCTIYLKALSDKPYKTKLSWTPYVGWDTIYRYEIYRSNQNNQNYKLIGITDYNNRTFIDSGLCDMDYYYQIFAINDQLVSKSNKVKIKPLFQHLQQFTDIKTISIDKNNALEINIIDSKNPNFKQYQIEQLQISNNSKTIIESSNSTILIENIDVKQKYEFRVNEIDKCNYVNLSRNIGTNIVLNGESKSYQSFLSFNKYRNFMDDTKEHLVEITLFNEKSIYIPISKNDSTFIHDQKNLIINGPICYRIISVSNNLKDSSISNQICLTSESQLWVPNAFSPNGDGVNDVFMVKSIFVYNSNTTNFKGQMFDFEIFNRYGQKIFQTNDINATWDGSFENKLLPIGSYMYKIKAFGIDNKSYTLNGTITILK